MVTALLSFFASRSTNPNFQPTLLFLGTLWLDSWIVYYIFEALFGR